MTEHGEGTGWARQAHPVLLILGAGAALAGVMVGLAVLARAFGPGGDEGTEFDTTGMRGRTAQVCGIPVERLRDEQVFRDSVVWAWTDDAGRQRSASLSFVGQGIACG